MCVFPSVCVYFYLLHSTDFIFKTIVKVLYHHLKQAPGNPLVIVFEL